MEYRVTGFWHLIFQTACIGPQPSILWLQLVTGQVTARRSDSTWSVVKSLASVLLLQAVRRRLTYVARFPAKLRYASRFWSQLTLNDHVRIAESPLQTIRYQHEEGNRREGGKLWFTVVNLGVLGLLPSFTTVRFDIRRQTTEGFLANHLVSSAKPAVWTNRALKHKTWSKTV